MKMIALIFFLSKDIYDVIRNLKLSKDITMLIS